MTLFSTPSRCSTMILLFLTACFATTALISTADTADARQRRHHSASNRPALPAVPPVPQSKPGSESAADAPKPEEKPAEAVQKADPETTPVPEQKPEHDAKPADKPEVKPAEQLGPNRPIEDEAEGKSQPKSNDEDTAEKSDPATSPDRVYQNACPALMNGEVQGEIIPPLSEGMCGERSPLKITAIGKENPIKFAAPVTTNCTMAGTLAVWIGDVEKAAQKSFGAGIESIGTGSDYQCRKVNNGHKGRVSEHAFANALDIMSFKFSNGKTTELATGWKGTPEEQEFWRSIHKTSCEQFMTVIGPDGDAAHQGNIHLDLGCHGKSCKARLCQ
ncbi:extensin [Phyllobacterium sp. 628]|uniref:extensin-like domain-containing protein n=1 Tax=Phyllobacterium sp. 628 TaxID=2718938 RepID=UPI001662435D|nr:extensin family protein [Phyllobacterium sp. 628]QND53351.1 extensin [Phyllobacterium sp. 628]